MMTTTFRLGRSILIFLAVFFLFHFSGSVWAESKEGTSVTSSETGPGGGIIPPDGGTITFPTIPQIVPPKFDPKPPEGENVMTRMLNAAMSATEIMAVYLNRTLLEQLVWIAKWLAVGFALGSFFITYFSNPQMEVEALIGTFLRFGVCVALVTCAPEIISGFFKMGCSLAEVSGAGKMQRDLRMRVDKDFDQFWTDQFLVDVSADPSMEKVSLRKLDQRTGEIKSYVSVLSNFETKLPSISVVTENASPTTWSVPGMIAVTSFSRTILEFSNVMLTFLLFFLKVGLVLVSPFMCALGINRDFTQRAVKNFAWTTVFVMLFLPIVTRILGIFSYLAADLCLSSVREAQHTWDPQTFHAITARGSDMAMSCGAFSVVSIIASLAVFASPIVVYRLSTGDAAQAFTGLAGQWMLSLAATGIGVYSSAIGAGLMKQSESMQANTTANVQNDQAKQENKWQKDINQANAQAQHTQVEGARRMGLSSVEAGRISSVGGAEAQRQYERSTNLAHNRQTMGALGTERRIGETAFNETYNREMHPVRTAGAITGALPGLQGTSDLVQRTQAGIEGLQLGQPDLRFPLGHNPALDGRPQPYLTDSVFPSAMSARSNILRQDYMQRVNENYATEMTAAADTKGDSMIGVANRSAGVAAGGVNANAGAGHRAVEIVLGAQNTVADQQMLAKIGWNEQIRDTALEAANIRAWANVFGKAGDQFSGHLRELGNMYRV